MSDLLSCFAGCLPSPFKTHWERGKTFFYHYYYYWWCYYYCYCCVLYVSWQQPSANFPDFLLFFSPPFQKMSICYLSFPDSNSGKLNVSALRIWLCRLCNVFICGCVTCLFWASSVVCVLSQITSVCVAAVIEQSVHSANYTSHSLGCSYTCPVSGSVHHTRAVTSSRAHTVTSRSTLRQP